jgi:hypothetical protein
MCKYHGKFAILNFKSSSCGFKSILKLPVLSQQKVPAKAQQFPSRTTGLQESFEKNHFNSPVKHRIITPFL